MEIQQQPIVTKHSVRITTIAVILIALIGSSLAGGIIGYSLSYSALNEKLENINNQIQNIPENNNNYSHPQSNFSGDNSSLSQLYEQVKASIVVIRGLVGQYDLFRRPYYSSVQGSGFIYNLDGQMLVITNNHVVKDAINITVTFINGNGYPAVVLGSDIYADLAILSANAPKSEFRPLEIIDSSTLRVGDSLIAVGGPYGLAGSMTTGIVSALGRTISEDLTGGYPIANVIQTSTPINPGNSGGPLLNHAGQVVGITTAVVSDSQALGFAIPSSTILREISLLVNEGSYNNHPTIGAGGTDMTYEIAEAMKVKVTYGWLIAQVTSGGPADKAGLQGGTKQTTVAGEVIIIGGDIIVAINRVPIKNLDDLSAFLEEHTIPGQVITVTIVRGNQTMDLQITVGIRPAPT
ncbi:MAG: trypsin-like peptidase domain-containing protein [Candidatus Bathyarchaeota archaeon]|nr:trypsin-like peptidase domain-containing protein [Candidatus Bathyarchaeota archaeon]